VVVCVGGWVGESRKREDEEATEAEESLPLAKFGMSTRQIKLYDHTFFFSFFFILPFPFSPSLLFLFLFLFGCWLSAIEEAQGHTLTHTHAHTECQEVVV